MPESRVAMLSCLFFIVLYLGWQITQPKSIVQSSSLPLIVSTCPSRVIGSVRLEVLSPIRSDELRLRLEGESSRIRISWQNSSLSVNSADSCQGGVCRVALPSTAPALLEVQLDNCQKVWVNP